MLTTVFRCLVMLSVAGSAAAGSAAARAPAPAPQLEAEIRTLTLRRADRTASSLTRDARLTGIARSHSREMFARDTLAHELDGVGPAERVARQHRRLFGLVAENVAVHKHWPDGRNLAASLVEGWMTSPGHRANILAPYEVFEVGCYGNGTRMYCTQLFVRAAAWLEEPLAYEQPTGGAAALRLPGLTGAPAASHRVSIEPAGSAPDGPGTALEQGAARLALPASPGLYQLSLWTRQADDPRRYRIVSGPLTCLRGSAAEKAVSPPRCGR